MSTWSPVPSLPVHPRNFLSLPRLTLLFVLWLCTGFALGTSTLLGPVQWMTSAVQSRGVSPSTESALVVLVIVALVAVSLALALFLGAVALRRSTLLVRLGAVLIPVTAALAACWLWLSPELLRPEMAEESVMSVASKTVSGSDREPTSQFSVRFVFGPYPTAERLRELEAEGFAAVISLLHPAVVPFETKLLADERRHASEAGIELIHLPMIPWVSSNADSLDALEEIARTGEGSYYVHCYIGRDRVQIAKRVVRQAGGSPTLSRSHPHPEYESIPEYNSLVLADGGLREFERGPVERLGDHGFVIPFPTDDEFIRFVAGGSARSFVSLLDPDRQTVQKARALSESYQVRFELLPIPTSDYDPWRALAVARQIRELPGPVMAAAFFASTSGQAPAAEALLQAFRSDLPPLPTSFFEGSRFQPIAPHTVAGANAPTEDEWRFLYEAGVREAIEVVDPGVSTSPREGGAGIELRAVEAGALDVRVDLAGGGPYLLFGSALGDDLESLVAEVFGLPGAVPASSHELARLEGSPRSGVASTVSPAGPAVSPGISLLEGALPSYRNMVIWTPFMLIVAGLCGGLPAWLRRSRKLEAPYSRKAFHFLIFSLAGVFHIYWGFPAVLWFGGLTSLVVLYAVLLGDGFGLYEALARPSDAPHRSLFVIVPLTTTALGGLATNFLFPGFSAVGYLVTGWGDALGEPVGTKWGRHRYRVPSLAGVPCTRSLEGSSAVFLGATLAAIAALLLIGIEPGSAWKVGLVCGGASALVEAVSSHGTDNLTIQLAAAGIAYWWLA